MLLFDVEGIDLGDDIVIDCLSMFIVMMFFRLNVFVVDFLGNVDIDFFYWMVCLSNFVFKDKNILDYFLKL